MNKLIGIYIFIILLIVGFSIFTYSPYVYPTTGVPFPSVLHKTFEAIITLLLFGIFWRTNKLYSQTKEKRMALIAGGFLVASLLNVYHLAIAYGFPYDILTVENIQRNPKLFYLLVEKLIIAITLFISVFYTGISSDITEKHYRSKIYSIFFGIVFISIILDQVIAPLFPSPYANKVFLLEQTFEILDESLYFLTALLYVDMMLINQKKIFCPFVVGLFILGLSQLFYISSPLTPLFGIIAHIMKIIGFSVILWDTRCLQVSINAISFRQKLLAYLSIFLILSYLLFSALIAVIFNIRLPIFSEYLFLEFLLISAIIQYILITRFIQPLADITKAVQRYKIGQKPESIDIKSNDEIGILANTLNETTSQNWEYTQQINQAKEREKLLVKIIALIRSTLDINEVKRNIVNAVGRTFNADRCYFRAFDKIANEFLAPDIEYLASPDIKSLMNVTPDQEGLRYFFDILEKRKRGSYPIEVDVDSVKDTPVEKYMKDAGILVDYAIPIWDREDELTYLVLHYIKQKPHLGKEEKELLAAISEQIKIAFDQSKLYDAVKKNADREKLLKEIISELKLSQNLDQAYNYVLKKLAVIFDVDRTLFIEFQTQNSNKPFTKYEYLKDPSLPSLMGQEYPGATSVDFYEMLNNPAHSDILVVNNTEEHHKNDPVAQDFLREYGIKSMMATLLVRYNKSIRVLGSIVIFLYL